MLNQARAKSDRVQWLRGPAEQLPFDDGALDAVVTTSAFHFFDQPAALREFHRVLAPGGLVAVSALSTRQPRLQSSAQNRWKPQHNTSAPEMRALFERRVRDQRSAPDPAAGLDPPRVRPVDRRHQTLKLASNRGKHSPPTH